MARNWQYPRWRRLLMQSAMWVILGGTVALAALLDRHQHEQLRTVLGPAVQCGAVRLQLPEHWIIQYSDNGMVTATEAVTYPPRRNLEVTVAPPAEAGLIDQLLQKENAGSPQPVTFGASTTRPGNLYSWTRQIDEDDQTGVLGRVIATTILPSGPEVTLRLEHAALNDQQLETDDDISLVRRIAATVQYDPAEPPAQQD